jgi:hypothetical protein
MCARRHNERWVMGTARNSQRSVDMYRAVNAKRYATRFRLRYRSCGRLTKPVRKSIQEQAAAGRGAQNAQDARNFATRPEGQRRGQG